MRIVRYSYPTYRTLVPTRDIFARSTWSGLESEIDRLFESATRGSGGVLSTRIPVDLYEDKDNSYVRAELPGVNRADIDVEVVDGVLTIAGTRKTPVTAPADPAPPAKADDSFSFNRSVTLPSEVQADKVTATYENGVLTVTLPKREEVKPKKITVAVN